MFDFDFLINVRYWAKITVKALAITIALLFATSAMSDMLFGIYPNIFIFMGIVFPITLGFTVYFS